MLHTGERLAKTPLWDGNHELNNCRVSRIGARRRNFASVSHYLRRVIAHMRKPPTRIAKEAGVAASTLMRLLNETSTATLHARTIGRLQEYSDVSFFGGDPSSPATFRGLAEDAVPFEAKARIRRSCQQSKR